jgi:hypothetical protein
MKISEKIKTKFKFKSKKEVTDAHINLNKDFENKKEEDFNLSNVSSEILEEEKIMFKPFGE